MVIHVFRVLVPEIGALLRDAEVKQLAAVRLHHLLQPRELPRRFRGLSGEILRAVVAVAVEGQQQVLPHHYVVHDRSLQQQIQKGLGFYEARAGYVLVAEVFIQVRHIGAVPERCEISLGQGRGAAVFVEKRVV